MKTNKNTLPKIPPAARKPQPDKTCQQPPATGTADVDEPLDESLDESADESADESLDEPAVNRRMNRWMSRRMSQ